LQVKGSDVGETEKDKNDQPSNAAVTDQSSEMQEPAKEEKPAQVPSLVMKAAPTTTDAPSSPRHGPGVSSPRSPRATGKLSGTQALLRWVQKRTDFVYADVDLGNWKNSWQDGLGLCALAHHFFPAEIDYASLVNTTRDDWRYNIKLAFAVFEAHGVPQLLDPEDLVDVETVEPRSMQTYLSEIRKRLDPQPDDSPMFDRKLVPQPGPHNSRGVCPHCQYDGNANGFRECKRCGKVNV
jgi:hypothetical protein